MGLNSTSNINRYVGNGATSVYDYTFKIFNQAHLEVVVTDTDGVEQTLVLATDYTVTGVGVGTGGQISLVAGALTTDYIITIRRIVPLTQTTDIKNQGDYFAKTHEDTFDRLTMIDQQQQEELNRSVKTPKAITPAQFDPTLPQDITELPGYVMVINEDGDGFTLENPETIGGGGDFVETIDNNDYTATPDLSEYVAATNKIVFAGTGIDSILSIGPGVAGQRLMLVNQTGVTIDVINEDPGETANARISTGTNGDIEFTDGSVLFLNYDGNSNTWRIVGGTGGAGVLLGSPTDGSYGGAIGPIAGITLGDRVEDAFDKVDTILGLLAPQPPDLLSAKTLLVTGSYDALEASTGTPHPVVVNDTTPEISPGIAVTFANSFRDGKTGTLSAEMDSVEVGSITLTAADDTGINGQLEIIDDFDPYIGQFGKEGFWAGLIARINSAALSVGSHIAELIHTTTGSTSLTFWVDDAVTPSSTNRVLSSSGSSSFKSGVPGVAQGQTINVAFDAVNAVKTHYNSARIGRATCTQTNSANAALPGSPPAPDAVVPISINLTVAASAYSENVSANCIVYNSAGTTSTNAVTAANNIRVDTVGSEASRLTSGTGQYPSSGYGSAFNSSTSLATASYFELQYLNGVYRDPPAVDYSTKYPVGPNYSALSYDAHNSMRWATFSLGSVSSVTSVTFTIAGATNFGATALVSGIELYVRVDGGTPTTGWVDANAAYPGVGNPTANGDAALDVGNSTASVKRVTFGAAVKTGTCYVRIGIPSGSNKTFTGIS